MKNFATSNFSGSSPAFTNASAISCSEEVTSVLIGVGFAETTVDRATGHRLRTGPVSSAQTFAHSSRWVLLHTCALAIRPR